MTTLLIGLFLGFAAGFAFAALAVRTEAVELEAEIRARREAAERARHWLGVAIRTSDKIEWMRATCRCAWHALTDSPRLLSHVVDELPSERRARKKRERGTKKGDTKWI